MVPQRGQGADWRLRLAPSSPISAMRHDCGQRDFTHEAGSPQGEPSGGGVTRRKISWRHQPVKQGAAIMALPDFSMRQLLEAGVHFGHQKHRWNPKMERYIFGVRNDIHILDLSQTVPALSRALQLISDTVADGGRVLFVGTKRQAAPLVADAAKQSAQYYVNSRWLGGTLTNWQTISNSIARLRELEAMGEDELSLRTKKERLMMSREKERLERDLGGIKDMGNVPSLLFVIDTNKEANAIKEARRLGIPVIAIVDTNSDPDTVDYPIPGNDDASRALELYVSLVSKAAIDGIGRSSSALGADLGAADQAPAEDLPEETAAAN
jgi:small subunit ribosomal protein S2